MAITPVSSLITHFSFADDVDNNQLLLEIGRATWEKLAGVHANFSAAAAERLKKLQALNTLSSKLAGFATIDDGKRAVLGSDLAEGNAVKADLAAAGMTLATDQTYNIAVVTKDDKGNSVVGTKRAATAAERTAIEAGTLVTAANDKGEETRSVTVDGTTTTYTLFKNETLLTASKADLDDFLAAIPGLAQELVNEVEMGRARIQSIGTAMKEEEDKMLEPSRKHQRHVAETRVSEKRDALIDRSIHRQGRDREDDRHAASNPLRPHKQ
jgi:hypothetical protein